MNTAIQPKISANTMISNAVSEKNPTAGTKSTIDATRAPRNYHADTK